MVKKASRRGLLKFDAARILLIVLDLLVVIASLSLSTAVYFDFHVPEPFYAQAMVHGSLLLLLTLATFSYLHLYSRRVPVLGERQMRKLLFASTAVFFSFFVVASYLPTQLWGEFFLFLGTLFLTRAVIGLLVSYGILRGGYWIYVVPLLLGVAGAGVGWLFDFSERLGFDEQLPVSRVISLSYFLLSTAGFIAIRWAESQIWGVWHREKRKLRKVYLYGELDDLSLFLRSEAGKGLEYWGLFTDSPAHWGTRLNGILVKGGGDALIVACKEQRPDAVVFAHPGLSSEIAPLREKLRALTIRSLEVDSWGGLLGSAIPRAEEISMEAVMERPEYRFLPREEENYLRDKVVLVTGAGGSIGSELCRQVLACSPAKLLLVGHGENSVVNLYRRFSKEEQRLSVPQILSVVDEEGLRRLFARWKPQIVFHAAAHKHVDLMEQNRSEAVRNNVEGTRCLLKIVEEYRCERFLLVSTDKAVDPINTMGRTKLLGELLTALAREQNPNTDYRVVRFGNVLGSRGSVIPLFLEQIRRGGPITITDPQMKRYFMSIPEAVSLVLEAGCIEDSTGIFVLEMGEPVSILSMAEGIVRQCGLEPRVDIPFQTIGARPGERLDESLVASDEVIEETGREKIRRVRSHRSIAERMAEQQEALQKALDSER